MAADTTSSHSFPRMAGPQREPCLFHTQTHRITHTTHTQTYCIYGHMHIQYTNIHTYTWLYSIVVYVQALTEHPTPKLQTVKEMQQFATF